MPSVSRLRNDREFLAVDAGGTSSRAAAVDADGRCLGYGRAAGGNPTSVGTPAAVAAIASALEQALTGPGREPARVELVLLAHAGADTAEYRDGIAARLAPLGLRAPITSAGDLLALFASGTAETEGAALIAGTGAIGGAIRDGGLARVVDGTGWLLGDAGSGFWIGHRIARAVVDDLDGGRSTRLTGALLTELALADDRTPRAGRPVVLGALVSALYAIRPVELSRFAPLAFALAGEDAEADRILREAAESMTALLHRVRHAQADGPVVFGGSVLVEGFLRRPELAAPLLDAAGVPPVVAPDGLVGAAVLALRAGGVDVDAALFGELTRSIGAAAAGWTPPARR